MPGLSSGRGSCGSYHGTHHPAYIHHAAPLRVVFGRVLQKVEALVQDLKADINDVLFELIRHLKGEIREKQKGVEARNLGMTSFSRVMCLREEGSGVQPQDKILQ